MNDYDKAKVAAREKLADLTLGDAAKDVIAEAIAISALNVRTSDQQVLDDVLGALHTVASTTGDQLRPAVNAALAAVA
jgi:hypothetical protein